MNTKSKRQRRKRLRRRASLAMVIIGVLALVSAGVMLITAPDDSSGVLSGEQPRRQPDSGQSYQDSRPKPSDNAPKPKALEMSTSTAFAGQFAGLGGAGYTGKYNGHKITITVSSTEPIGTWGFVVPTSTSTSYGKYTTTSTRAGVSTVAYGPPDYARVFVQAGYSGQAITCTVTVDGRVTDQRTAKGRYVQTMCQG